MRPTAWYIDCASKRVEMKAIMASSAQISIDMAALRDFDLD
jgi:hypothetical protein